MQKVMDPIFLTNNLFAQILCRTYFCNLASLTGYFFVCFLQKSPQVSPNAQTAQTKTFTFPNVKEALGTEKSSSSTSSATGQPATAQWVTFEFSGHFERVPQWFIANYDQVRFHRAPSLLLRALTMI